MPTFRMQCNATICFDVEAATQADARAIALDLLTDEWQLGVKIDEAMDAFVYPDSSEIDVIDIYEDSEEGDHGKAR